MSIDAAGYAPWPVYDDEQVAAAERVLRSGRVNYWTGDEGRLFEREFADCTGIGHAVFVANGTLGLEAAVEALDLPAGSEVITTPRTFIASASALVRRGLVPVFADVDLASGNITVESIAEALTDRTSAVLVVHLGGWPADVAALREFCDARNLALIEDCSQAHGAMVDGQHVGTFGDVSVWSFCQDKIITTAGEGGMVATNDQALARRVWSIKDHGKSWEAVYEREHPPGFRWLHESFGSNYRGTEIAAAVGRIQYRRLEQWRAQRTANAATLRELLARADTFVVPTPGSRFVHAYYRLYAYLDSPSPHAGHLRDRIVAEAQRAGAAVFSGSCSEIYKELAFTAQAPAAVPLANAARLGDAALAFLVHPGMTEQQLNAAAAHVTDAAALAETGRP